jgi:hypothetical protein
VDQSVVSQEESAPGPPRASLRFQPSGTWRARGARIVPKST